MTSLPRRPDLDDRLDAYFSTLRCSSLKDVLKHRAGNWQVYAAVTAGHGDADRCFSSRAGERRSGNSRRNPSPVFATPDN